MFVELRDCEEEERTIVGEAGKENVEFSIDPNLQNSTLGFILLCSRKLLRWFEQEDDQRQFSFLQILSLDFQTMACLWPLLLVYETTILE